MVNMWREYSLLLVVVVFTAGCVTEPQKKADLELETSGIEGNSSIMTPTQICDAANFINVTRADVLNKTRVAPHYLSRFKEQAEKNFLKNVGNWTFLNVDTVTDSIPAFANRIPAGGPRSCWVISTFYYLAPKRVADRVIPVKLGISYYSGDLSLGDENVSGPYPGEVDLAIDEGLNRISQDKILLELINGGPLNASYDFEYDRLCMANEELSVCYRFGRGKDRGSYPPNREFIIEATIPFGYEGLNGFTLAREKFKEALDSSNASGSIQCSPWEKVDAYYESDTWEYRFGLESPDDTRCPCRIYVFLKDREGRIEYSDHKLIFSGHQGCIG